MGQVSKICGDAINELYIERKLKTIEHEWGTKKLEFDTKERNPKLAPNSSVFEV